MTRRRKRPLVSRPCPLPGCTLDHRHKGAHLVAGAEVARLPDDPRRPVGRPRTRPPRTARATIADPVSLTVRISSAMRAALDETATAQGVTVGAVVRGAIGGVVGGASE